jgi:hypothetical protein
MRIFSSTSVMAAPDLSFHREVRRLLSLFFLSALTFGASLARAETPAPAGAAQLSSDAPARISSRSEVSIQGGISAVALTAEAEIAASWGGVFGLGVHGGGHVPVGGTARLAYEVVRLGDWRLRAGLRAYPFAEGDCDPCAFLVPEIGVRFVGPSGFVFEFDEPVVRINLNRVSSGGWRGVEADQENSLLMSLLVGFAW